MSTPPPWWRRWALVAALAAAYVAAARLGLLLGLPPEKKATAVWPPSGIALAALVLFGGRAWQGVWLGAFLANVWDYFVPGARGSLAAHGGVSAGIAVGSTLQALAGAWVTRRWLGGADFLDRTGGVLRFVGAAPLVCLIAASVGVVSLCVGGVAPWGSFGAIWATWWMGDTAGVFLLAPLLLAWGRGAGAGGRAGGAAEGAGLGIALVGVGLFVFGDWSAWGARSSPLAYLSMPLLVWAAVRFGSGGATAALAAVAGLAVWGTVNGSGPFVRDTLNESLLLLEVFMGVVTVTALVLSATLAERRQAEEALRRSERRFREVTEQLPQLVWTCRPDGRCDYLSPQWVGYTGVPEADQLGYGWLEAVHPDDRPGLQARWERSVGTGEPFDVEFRIRGGTGAYRWYRTRALPLRDEGGAIVKWFGTNTDADDERRAAEVLQREVAQRREAEEGLRRAQAELEGKVLRRTEELSAANERLQASVAEKQVLLQEVHHRVKNNLQVISSLLDLQARQARGDAAVVEMFRESQGRVRAMAMVHERLYRSAALGEVDFAAYLHDLAGTLWRAYQPARGGVGLDLDLGPVRLGIAQAVPCGLAVNELLTNALKHAFPAGGGTITVRLAESGGEVRLVVRDDGVGLAGPPDLGQAGTFGLRLVAAFVEQLRGRAEVDREGGTAVRITFAAGRPAGPPAGRHASCVE